MYFKTIKKNVRKEKFKEAFEKLVLKTVKKYKLINKNEKVAIAFSGGKDSLTLLYILRKYYDVVAITIDNNIKDFSYKYVKKVKEICKILNVKLYLSSFKEEFNLKLSDIANEKNACNICSSLRRYLINKIARNLKVSKVVTGHNLDDEVQNFLLNLIRNDKLNLAKSKIITGVIKNSKFVPRIKPLRYVYEEDVKKFALLLKEEGITFFDEQCPYKKSSIREEIREYLNELERKYGRVKEKMIKVSDKLSKILESKIKKEIHYCKICGEVSSKEICRKCLIVEGLKNENKNFGRKNN